jgi:DNA repair protein RecO (recombination protein O)
MYQKLTGIVLHSLKYNDTSNIVDVYTEQSGRMSFLVKIPRSRKSGMRSVLFQPLALVELEADVRPTSNLHRIREAKLLYPFHSLPYHPYKSSIAMFLAEFLYRALKEEASNEPLFAYLMHSIRWLDECEDRPFSNFHLVFLMRLSRFLGLYPNVEDYTEGCYFDMLNASFTPLLPKRGAFLKPDEASRIRLLLRMNYETMHLFAMSRTERNRCLMVINDYYRLHLPDFPILKSIDVLKELFD